MNNPNTHRGSDAVRVRPWTTGIEAPHPQCSACTWVHAGGVFKLKFVNRACRKHGKLAGT
jgi:hypothetical protein